MATQTVRDVSFDTLLSKTHPAGDRCYLRCATGPAPDQPENFFTRVGNSWRALDQAQGSVEDFIGAHGAHGMRFSPVARGSYSYGGPMLFCNALWASVQGEPANGAKPSITIHEGDRVTALWLLRSPIYDERELKTLLERLRRIHGGDPSLADPRDASIAITQPTVQLQRPAPAGQSFIITRHEGIAVIKVFSGLPRARRPTAGARVGRHAR